MKQVSEPRTRKDRRLSEFSLHLIKCRTTPFVSTRIERIVVVSEPPTTIDTGVKITEKDNSCLPSGNEALGTVSADTCDKSDSAQEVQKSVFKLKKNHNQPKGLTTKPPIYVGLKHNCDLSN